MPLAATQEDVKSLVVNAVFTPDRLRLTIKYKELRE